MINKLRFFALVLMVALNTYLAIQLRESSAKIAELNDTNARLKITLQGALTCGEMANHAVASSNELLSRAKGTLESESDILKKLAKIEFSAGVQCGISALLDVLAAKGHISGPVKLTPGDLASREFVEAINAHRASDYPELPKIEVSRIVEQQ